MEVLTITVKLLKVEMVISMNKIKPKYFLINSDIKISSGK